MNNQLGRCDFKQYEHCGSHERIPSVGQRLPPFGCKNWAADTVPATIIQVPCPNCKGGGTRVIEDARYTSRSQFRVEDQILCDCLNGRVEGCSICLKPVELGCEHIEV